MESRVAPASTMLPREEATEGGAAIPWYLTAVLFASTSVVVGVIWDISWHQTIGRDTFWTPAHMAIYLGGIAAGVACGSLALKTTFGGTDTEVGRSVRFWGFRAPFGAWVAIWGSIAMITSGPFDDWWHNAYGLDVQVLSPPHVVLALGIMAIQVGALLMALAWQNRSSEGAQRGLSLAYAYGAGMLIATLAVLFTEYTFANDMHGSTFYRIGAAAFPLVLFGVARAGRLRWPATAAALVYTALVLLLMWGLPLFPAEPLLAPIMRPITSMVPPEFPLLLILPAVAIDVLLRRFSPPGEPPARRSADWILAALGAVAFVGLFWIAHWTFGMFMLSESSRNFVFQGDTWPYTTRPGDWQHEFWIEDVDAAGEFSPGVFARRFAWTFPIAFVSARVGLWWGNWMSRVRR